MWLHMWSQASLSAPASQMKVIWWSVSSLTASCLDFPLPPACPPSSPSSLATSPTSSDIRVLTIQLESTSPCSWSSQQCMFLPYKYWCDVLSPIISPWYYSVTYIYILTSGSYPESKSVSMSVFMSWNPYLYPCPPSVSMSVICIHVLHPCPYLSSVSMSVIRVQVIFKVNCIEKS